MTLILTNDDGIDAPGIRSLYQAVTFLGDSIADSIIIAAPQDHYSGCGHQVTTTRPIQVERRSAGEFAIGGTPADCTRIALKHLAPTAKLVISGINAGGNLGADVYISGTVAAVREAAFHRIPGIAISHYIHRRRSVDWDRAAYLARLAIDKLLHHPPEPGTFWNVNLPHLEPDAPDPNILFCPLCTQPLPNDYQVNGDTFLYAGNYGERDRDPGSDVEVCFSGNIAVTQIRL